MNKGILTCAESDFLQIPLQVLSDDASFHASRQIIRVDPQDFVHLRHVQRDDHTRFGGRAKQGARHTGSTAKRNQNHIVFTGWRWGKKRKNYEM